MKAANPRNVTSNTNNLETLWPHRIFEGRSPSLNKIIGVS